MNEELRLLRQEYFALVDAREKDVKVRGVNVLVHEFLTRERELAEKIRALRKKLGLYYDRSAFLSHRPTKKWTKRVSLMTDAEKAQFRSKP